MPCSAKASRVVSRPNVLVGAWRVPCCSKRFRRKRGMTGILYSTSTARSVELGPFNSAPATTGHWQNWQLARDDQGVAWLLMDKHNSSVNVLSTDVLDELDGVVDGLYQL